MRFPVFLDTNVLYPVTLADTILRLAEVDVIRPRWSPHVMAELERNLAVRLGRAKAEKRCRTMADAFPDAMVTGYEELIAEMQNDPKDRHVLAAAVQSGCEVVVSFDAGGFAPRALEPYNVVAVAPDDFLLDQLDLYPQIVSQALRRQASATARPSLTLLDLIEHFERMRLVGFAAELRRSWPEHGT